MTTALRKDPVSGTWVIIDTDRATRVRLAGRTGPSRPEDGCPWCEGNEAQTPSEIRAYGRERFAPDTPGWQVRVVPQKSPLLRVEGELEHEGENGVYDRMSGIGAHEVVLLSPRHDVQLADLSEDHVHLVLRACQERVADLMRDDRMQFVMFVGSCGETDGNIRHPHFQIAATPIVPKRVNEEMKGGRLYFEYKERCVFCDMIRQDINQKDRIVAADEHMVALTPFASRFPFEITLLPRQHSHDFLDASDAVLRSFARLLRRVMRQLRLALADSDWSLLLHTCPREDARARQEFRPEEYYHWHLEIVPRLLKTAGFEWGTGFYINPVKPEEAASFLRAIEPDEVPAACSNG